MEYVPGPSLSERLAQGPAADALRFAHQIASALEASHTASIIHRDLKPSNILLTPEGSTKLVDFGLARLQNAEDEGEPARRVISGTRG